MYSPYIMTWGLVVRQIKENREGTGFIEIYEPKTRQVDQAVSELAHEHRR